MARSRKRNPDEVAPARRGSGPGSGSGASGGDGLREPRARIELVRKRDGRVVPFQRQKIADAVARAMEAAGEPDARFAAEVAGIVELSLLERAARSETPRAAPTVEIAPQAALADPAIPHIETIQDLVERALMELGRSAVAKAYILHRDLRARVRAVLRVHRSDTLRSPVRVREREGVSDWQKGRIVAALMQEAELPREAAEEVAAAVERRVFAAGKRSVTTGLVRELVANELFDRGWLSALTATRVVGLPRIDVKRVLSGQGLHPWRTLHPLAGSAGAAPAGETLAGELLSRYALESVLSDAAGELHRSGDVHVVGLETLGRPLSLCIDAELLLGGGDPARSAHAMLDELAALAPRVARVLVLERPASVLAPLVRTTREHSPHGLSAWIRGLAAIARASRVRIDLGSVGARYHASTARLIEELAELPAAGPGGDHAPRLHLEGPELEALLEGRPDLQPAIERLLAAGRLLPVWSGPEGTFAGPGCERRPDERGLVACAGAVALNLPRIARRAGPFREELFQSALAELVQAAVEIAGALRAQLALSPAGTGVRARASVALVPVGLREALRILGDGAIDVELAARALGFLGEAAHRYGRDGALERRPSPFFGAEAAARFAWLDARAAQSDGARQEWLFEAAEAALGEVRPYSTGFVLSPVGAALASGRAEAEALRTVPCGALDLSVLAAREGSERAALDAWRRFEVVRRSHTGELVLELFPREERPARLRPLV